MLSNLSSLSYSDSTCSRMIGWSGAVAAAEPRQTTSSQLPLKPLIVRSETPRSRNQIITSLCRENSPGFPDTRMPSEVKATSATSTDVRTIRPSSAARCLWTAKRCGNSSSFGKSSTAPSLDATPSISACCSSAASCCAAYARLCSSLLSFSLLAEHPTANPAMSQTRNNRHAFREGERALAFENSGAQREKGLVIADDLRAVRGETRANRGILQGQGSSRTNQNDASHPRTLPSKQVRAPLSNRDQQALVFGTTRAHCFPTLHVNLQLYLEQPRNGP